MTEDSPTMFAGAGARPDERGAPGRPGPSPRAGRRWSRACRSSVLLTSLGIVLLAPAPALAVPDGGVELVDRPTGFGELPFDGAAGAAVGPHAISADGCQVVMESDNDVLLALDDDRGRDIVRVDRCAPGQPAVLVSATAAGVPADGAAFGPTISADGTRVAFVTDAPNLLPPGTGARPAVVVKDLASGEVTVASRDHGSGGTVRGSVEATISGDGRAVAFISEYPVDAVNADGANREELYVRYLGDGATVMASANGAAGAGARAFDISRDGRRLALVSDAKLAGVDTDSDRDAYLTTVTPAGSVAHRLASRSLANDAAISSDGTWLAYASDRVWFTACAATDPCALPAQADNAPAGTSQYIRGLGFPRSTTGPTHVFWTTDRDLLPADTNGAPDLYASTLLASEISLPFGALGGATGGDITDGAGVAVASSASLELPGTDGLHPQVLARAGGTTTLLSQPAGAPARRTLAGNTTVASGAVSENGRVVAMDTGSAALGAPMVPGNFMRTPRVIVRDVVAGVTIVAGGDLAADRGTRSPSVDRAGARVAFESFSAAPVKALAPTDPHVHAHDLATGTTQLVDRLMDGTPVRDGARHASISEDGTKVAFTSSSPDLPGGGTYEHAYVADLATGAIAPVDVRKDGIPGDKSARDVVLDADGSRAAFVSSASNLGGGAGSGDKVYLKDFDTGEITYVSVPESGAPAQFAQYLSIDAAGTRVTWSEPSAQFGYGSDGRWHVFLRDLAAGTTRIVSGGGDPASEGQSGGELDSAGTHVVFTGWERSGAGIWLRDLGADAPVALGRLHDETPGGAGISPDGRCVALTSNATGLTPEPVGPDFTHVYLRAAGGECAPRPAGGPGDGGAAAGGSDTAAPVLSGVRMTRKRFAVARAATPRAAGLRRGSAFAFSLSEDARTSIAIARARPGRRAGGLCVRPRGATGPRCTRFTVVATLTRAGTRRGANRIAFSGRLGRRALPAGRYRATVGAVDAAGNRAAPRRLGFRIAGASR